MQKNIKSKQSTEVSYRNWNKLSATRDQYKLSEEILNLQKKVVRKSLKSQADFIKVLVVTGSHKDFYRIKILNLNIIF